MIRINLYIFVKIYGFCKCDVYCSKNVISAYNKLKKQLEILEIEYKLFSRKDKLILSKEYLYITNLII